MQDPLLHPDNSFYYSAFPVLSEWYFRKGTLPNSAARLWLILGKNTYRINVSVGSAVFLSMEQHRERCDQHSVKPLWSVDNMNLSEMTQANYFILFKQVLYIWGYKYVLHAIQYSLQRVTKSFDLQKLKKQKQN